MSKLFKQLTETKYLSTENAWRYRALMRCFYLNDQKFKHWMNKEQVFEELKHQKTFSDYSIEMCQQDLSSLVEWGNLSAYQDTTKVATYQQFVNKQYRYQMTEYAIEIERMTIRLENLFIEGGSLEPTLLERIKQELQKMPIIIDKESKDVGGWWSNLISDFQRLNQSYQDYIRDWNSLKADELMKTKNFLMYKEKLVDYLRHFIGELQYHAGEIALIIRNFDLDELELLFEKISEYELSIPRLDMEAVTEDMIISNIRDKYQSIHAFFISTHINSEVDNILSMTNEIIRKITRYAANILEMSSQYSSRKEEYLKIASLFGKVKDIKEAHTLAAQVFGIKSYQHLAGEFDRETESISSSILDEKAMKHILTPRVRTYREKLKKTAIIDHEDDKKKMRDEVLRKRKLEEEILMSYVNTGIVKFETLNDIPEIVRRTMLDWLIKGMQSKNHRAITEHGKKFKLVNPNEVRRCVVKCEDGNLELPAYVLEFEGE